MNEIERIHERIIVAKDHLLELCNLSTIRGDDPYDAYDKRKIREQAIVNQTIHLQEDIRSYYGQLYEYLNNRPYEYHEQTSFYQKLIEAGDALNECSYIAEHTLYSIYKEKHEILAADLDLGWELNEFEAEFGPNEEYPYDLYYKLYNDIEENLRSCQEEVFPMVCEIIEVDTRKSFDRPLWHKILEQIDPQTREMPPHIKEQKAGEIIYQHKQVSQAISETTEEDILTGQTDVIQEDKGSGPDLNI